MSWQTHSLAGHFESATTRAVERDFFRILELLGDLRIYYQVQCLHGVRRDRRTVVRGRERPITVGRERLVSVVQANSLVRDRPPAFGRPNTAKIEAAGQPCQILSRKILSF
jgi:hypothetical protein